MKKILKTLCALIVLSGLVGGFLYFFMNLESIPEESVCRKSDEFYTDKCDDVGKMAATKVMGRTITYGEIVGVAWRPRGTDVKGMGAKKFISDRHEYYYLISKDAGKTMFMQRVSTITPVAKQE